MHKKKVISHQIKQSESFDVIIEKITQRIKNVGDLPHVTVAKQLELLEELTLFPFGRFLLEKKGVNGYWAHYVIMHPQKGRLDGLNSEGKPFTYLEKFLLDKAPLFLSTQQRFVHFQHYLQQELKNDKILASIPCGLMGDLLTLDFSKVDNVKLIGIDFDQAALNEAAKLAKEAGLSDKAKFLCEDAWQLSATESFNVLASSGLNVFEPDDNKIIALYRQFYKTLVPNGILIMSFFTSPPDIDKASPWDMTKINIDDLLLQKTIFSIVNATWQCFRTVEETDRQVKEAGFSKVEFVYDNAKIMPTVIAKK